MMDVLSTACISFFLVVMVFNYLKGSSDED
jgi:hypothetical protein